MKKYRWNARKCAKNMGLLLLRMAFCFILCIVLGLAQIGG